MNVIILHHAGQEELSRKDAAVDFRNGDRGIPHVNVYSRLSFFRKQRRPYNQQELQRMMMHQMVLQGDTRGMLQSLAGAERRTPFYSVLANLEPLRYL